MGDFRIDWLVRRICGHCKIIVSADEHSDVGLAVFRTTEEARDAVSIRFSSSRTACPIVFQPMPITLFLKKLS